MSGVDLLPAWPTSGDSEAAFNTKADALGPALSTMITQINTALGVTNISAWVSGAAYTAGSSVVWSLINFRPYRRKTTSSAGTTDPSLDTTNWAPVDIAVVDASGNVTIPGTQVAIQTGGIERLRIDTSGRLINGPGSASDTGAANARLVMVAGNLGGPIASGTTDANVNYRFTHSSVALDNGVYIAGHVWWQARSLTNYATNYDINFQPNGGNTLHVGPNGGLGYGTGSGGTVTQATSRTTAVTLNKPSGDITLFTAAGSATPATFRVSNTLAASTDVPTISVRSASNKYVAIVTDVIASTGFDITFWSASGTASDTPIFHFNLGKGANA